MLRGESLDRREVPARRVPDVELGLAAVLVGVMLLLATIVVPIIG